MKKTLLRVVRAIVVVMMALSVVVNAENKIGFTSDYIGSDGARVSDGKLHVDPGYKDANFADADGGAFVANGALQHCIWALEKANVANTKYLHFTIKSEDADAIVRIGAYHGFGWDISKLQVFAGSEIGSTEAKEYVIDLSTLPAWDDEGASWTYFNICLQADRPVAFDIYLTDGATDEVPAVETADVIGIFATIAAAAAAVVVFTKKH